MAIPKKTIPKKAVPKKKKTKKGMVGGIDFTKAYLCTACGCQRDPILVRRGNMFVEIIMWMCYIVPGVIYSLWRFLRRHEVCPNCLHPEMIRTGSSQAFQLKRLMKELSQPESKPEKEMGS